MAGVLGRGIEAGWNEDAERCKGGKRGRLFENLRWMSMRRVWLWHGLPTDDWLMTTRSSDLCWSNLWP